MDELLTLHEIVEAARRKLPPDAWDYLIGGADTETTVARNRQAIDGLAFRPRILRDVSGVDTGVVRFGRTLALPLALAPVGSLASFDEGGVAAMARAAGRFGAIAMCGSIAAGGLEVVAAATEGPKIYQLYVRGGESEKIDDAARRAVDAGYDALCLTVDVAYPSRRERDIARRFVKPYAREGGAGGQATLSWDDIARFQDKGRLPLMLKGIATGEDAALAVEQGVAFVYVSNHGGRQLDHGRGTFDILPEVVRVVGGRASVWVDGGICRGTDILKAMALGADVVGIGRLYCYGLAAGGEAGVLRVLELLRDEATAALALCGVTGFSGLSAEHLHPVPPAMPPHVHSAFPLLER